MGARGPELPSELRAFLFTCIDSVEQLEILLLLTASPRPLTVKDVAALAGGVEAVARAHLEALVARGLLRVQASGPTTYTCAPRSAELERYLDLLVTWHRSSKSLIVGFVAAHARGGLRGFSDAFKLRDEDS